MAAWTHCDHEVETEEQLLPREAATQQVSQSVSQSLFNELESDADNKLVCHTQRYPGEQPAEINFSGLMVTSSAHTGL